MLEIEYVCEEKDRKMDVCHDQTVYVSQMIFKGFK